MEIIELLNLVHNGQAPKKIIYGYCEYEFNEGMYDYKNKDGLELFSYLFSNEEYALFKKVEIVEDIPKEISKINLGVLNDQKEKNRAFRDVINQLVDAVNEINKDKKGG